MAHTFQQLKVELLNHNIQINLVKKNSYIKDITFHLTLCIHRYCKNFTNIIMVEE